MICKLKITLASIVLIVSGCGKSFLDIKKIKNQNVPSTVEDFSYFMEGQYYDHAPYSLTEMSSDEFLIPPHQIPIIRGNAYAHTIPYYTWQKDIDMNAYEGYDDWFKAYSVIYMANITIEGLDGIKPQSSELDLYRRSMAIARFWRAYKYFQLAQTFSDVYRKDQDSPYGLPLRKSADITLKVNRSSVHELYQFMESDLMKSIPDLIETVDKNYFTRPYKVAGYSLMAKLYLVMDDYEKAGKYADSAIMLSGSLLDYNDMDVENPANSYQMMFPYDNRGEENPEVIFYNAIDQRNPMVRLGNSSLINPDFINLYKETDLRKYANFRAYSATNPKIGYCGSFAANEIFVGLSSGENYLIASESFARTNEIDKALERLNTLLKNRIRKVDYVPFTERDPETLLRFILDERKRELFGRGRRWEDLRRLNKDPRFAETLVRVIEGVRYELPPNDPRYMWPIPLSEIDAAKIRQNPR